MPEESRTKVDVLAELKLVCEQLRCLIVQEYPPTLIGALWSYLLISLFSKTEAGSETLAPVSAQENTIVFAMEYVHAVTACDASFPSEFKNVEEDALNQLLLLSEKAISLSFEYGFTKSSEETDLSEDRDRLEFQILSTWILIRGRRYQVLEEEFFRYVLSPHDDVLRELYGVGADEIAAGIQAAVDSLRAGIDDARSRINDLMDEVGAAAANNSASLEDIVKAANDQGPSEFGGRARSAIEDLFFGGVFNLSKRTKLPEAFLADLAYDPGENRSFFDGSAFSGTPFRTLPGRIKPLIRYSGGIFCTEPNLVRDATYRATQRAIIKRKESYREEWNRRQKVLSEDAFGDIMAGCLAGARVLKEVYYPIAGGQWAECDNLIIADDVLIVLECKARVEALAPPGENLASHVQSVDRLLVDAYRQNRRTLEYLASADEANLYRLGLETYEETATLRLRNFRKVFPICLTLECYTPFSAAIKELDGVEPILGQHMPIALSIDDLLAMKYVIREPGEFFHYLEVRQNLGSMDAVMLFDEMDHLGAYIARNRIDISVSKDFIEKQQMDMVYLEGFDQDVLGPYFQNPNWPDVEPPRQEYPTVVTEILSALQRTRAPGWLAGDSDLRDLGSEGRRQLSDFFSRVAANVLAKQWTHFAMAGEQALVFVIDRNDGADRSQLARAQGQAYALASGMPVRLYELSLSPTIEIVRARSSFVGPPSILQMDYGTINEEAARLKGKMIEV